MADGGQEAAFLLVGKLVEVFELLLGGSFGVILFGDGGVGLGVDLIFRERLNHSEGIAVQGTSSNGVVRWYRFQ